MEYCITNREIGFPSIKEQIMDANAYPAKTLPEYIIQSVIVSVHGSYFDGGVITLTETSNIAK